MTHPSSQDPSPLKGTVGLGLRSKWYEDILRLKPCDIAWFECISENYFTAADHELSTLEAIRQDYALVAHGTGLNLGSVEKPSDAYLQKLAQFKSRFAPTWISDHLCWNGKGAFHTHELLPLPFNEEAIDTVCRNILIAQDHLKEPILIENIASYLVFDNQPYTEPEFIAEIVKRTGCFLLLDLSNLIVNSINHGVQTKRWLSKIPLERVRQIHLGGYALKQHEISSQDPLALDTHGEEISARTWMLLQNFLIEYPHASPACMIERDQHLPDFSVILEECRTISRILKVFSKHETKRNTKSISPDLSAQN